MAPFISTLNSKIHFTLHTYYRRLPPPISKQVVKIDGLSRRVGYLHWQILLLYSVCSFGSKITVTWTQKAEIVETSSPYFIINTTNLATLAFALNRSNKNPFLTQSLAKKKALYDHFFLNKEYRNTLICLLFLSFIVWPLKICLLI